MKTKNGVLKMSCSRLVSSCCLIWLLVPATAFAEIPEDVCSNDQVPPTTASGDFTVLDNGSIVRHEVTGLEWRRCTYGQTWNGNNCEGSAIGRTWILALQVADNAGNGWRLPNVNELRSIVEECQNQPAINGQVFPNIPLSRFWTSSPYQLEADQAWYVYFAFDGRSAAWHKNNAYMIRLVRDGQ